MASKAKITGPDLKQYLDKKLSLKLNGGRVVVGVLLGYDQFMNLVLDRAVEEVSTSVKHDIGQIVIRGSGIVQLEALEAL